MFPAKKNTKFFTDFLPIKMKVEQTGPEPSWDHERNHFLIKNVKPTQGSPLAGVCHPPAPPTRETW